VLPFGVTFDACIWQNGAVKLDYCDPVSWRRYPYMHVDLGELFLITASLRTYMGTAFSVIYTTAAGLDLGSPIRTSSQIISIILIALC
jgi:hypothetical protein